MSATPGEPAVVFDLEGLLRSMRQARAAMDGDLSLELLTGLADALLVSLRHVYEEQDRETIGAALLALTACISQVSLESRTGWLNGPNTVTVIAFIGEQLVTTARAGRPT